MQKWRLSIKEPGGSEFSLEGSYEDVIRFYNILVMIKPRSYAISMMGVVVEKED